MQIHNGHFYNCDAVAYMQQMPSDCIDLIVTDPPYRVLSGGNGVSSKWHSGANGSVLAANDGKIFKHNDVKHVDYMQQFARILKPGTHCYVMTNALNLRELLNVADAVGLYLHNLLIWEKNNANANRWYMKHTEYVLLFYKKPAKPINNCGSKQIFKFDNPRNKSHPTEKPVELMQHYIENSSAAGELVFEPFAGSGATLIAAHQSGRRWLGCELDAQYYYPAAARLIGA